MKLNDYARKIVADLDDNKMLATKIAFYEASYDEHKITYAEMYVEAKDKDDNTHKFLYRVNTIKARVVITKKTCIAVEANS